MSTAHIGSSHITSIFTLITSLLNLQQSIGLQLKLNYWRFEISYKNEFTQPYGGQNFYRTKLNLHFMCSYHNGCQSEGISTRITITYLLTRNCRNKLHIIEAIG